MFVLTVRPSSNQRVCGEPRGDMHVDMARTAHIQGHGRSNGRPAGCAKIEVSLEVEALPFSTAADTSPSIGSVCQEAYELIMTPLVLM